jgi:hypothetical protein
MRLYIPVTFIGLRRAVSSGSLPASGWRAHLLPGATDDADSAEYAALRLAAHDSLDALRSEPEAPRRRAVAVANVPEEWTEPEPDGSVILTRKVPLDRIIAVYADSSASSPAVVKALTGKESPIDDTELLWFARQELPELVS